MPDRAYGDNARSGRLFCARASSRPAARQPGVQTLARTDEVLVEARPLAPEAVVRLAYAIARRLVGAEAGRDVAQDTWIKFRREAERQGGAWSEAAARAWVVSVAGNAARSLLRKASHAVLEAETEPVDDAAAPDEQVATDEERARRRARALELLGALPREKRELVALRDVEGRPWDEVARLLGEHAPTLRARYSRLWAELRARAQEGGE